MLVQKIEFDLMQNKLDDIRVVQGDTCREIQFEGEDLDGVLSYEDYRYTFNLMKSDGTFVIQDLTNGILIPTEQMEVITGTHYYSVTVKDADDNIVYSGQGAFIVDDNIITEDAIESVAEVNGLVFPDDFLTTDSPVALIDDTDTSADTTWSSIKISGEISGSVAGVIDDNATDSDTTWSSSKISAEIANVNPDIIYSNIAQKIGTWFGRDLWKKTFEDDIASYVNNSYYYHDLPAGAEVVLIEPNYCRYLYGGVWYRIAGYALCVAQGMQVSMEEAADDVARIQALYTIGGSLNGNPVKGAYTVYYTWSNE